MPKINKWKQIFGLITLIFLSFLGVKTASGSTLKPPGTQEQENSSRLLLKNQESLLAQTCSRDSIYKSPRPFARVTTQGDPLSIRSTPNGKIVSVVPNRWEVIPIRKDATGKWTYITSHYGTPGSNGFANAPRFRRDGWVSTAYLKALGRFCDKPANLRNSQLDTLSANQNLLINEDWVQRGDRIAKAITKN